MHHVKYSKTGKFLKDMTAQAYSVTDPDARKFVTCNTLDGKNRMINHHLPTIPPSLGFHSTDHAVAEKWHVANLQ